MEENINLIDSFYLPTIEKNVTENSSAVKILNDNHIDSHELLGINQEGTGTAFDRTHVNLPAPAAGLNYQFFCSASAADSVALSFLFAKSSSQTLLPL